MTATLTQSEEEAPTPLTAAEAFKTTAARETTLARMLILNSRLPCARDCRR
jgi:hypothetical protein